MVEVLLTVAEEHAQLLAEPTLAGEHRPRSRLRARSAPNPIDSVRSSASRPT